MWLLNLVTHWSDIDNVLKAGIKIATTVSDFLKDKPEFVAEMSESKGYTKHQPKTLTEAKSMKRDLRKEVQKKANSRKLQNVWTISSAS